ncbi:MAG TPA: hypothetical protein PKY59_02290 [Pyrinomonadaceae bacterium]|nr:hypothetical protein [Pyrinomonadaceae bacterium]
MKNLRFPTTKAKPKISNAESVWQSIKSKNVELSKISRKRIVSSKQSASAVKNKVHKSKIVVSLFIVFALLNRTKMNSP